MNSIRNQKQLRIPKQKTHTNMQNSMTVLQNINIMGMHGYTNNMKIMACLQNFPNNLQTKKNKTMYYNTPSTTNLKRKTQKQCIILICNQTCIIAKLQHQFWK